MPRRVAVSLHEQDHVRLLHKLLAPLRELLLALLNLFIFGSGSDGPLRARSAGNGLLARFVGRLGGDGLLGGGGEGGGFRGVRLERR